MMKHCVLGSTSCVSSNGDHYLLEVTHLELKVRSLKQAHSTTEMLRLKGTFGGHLVQTPCSKLEQIILSCPATFSTILQGWGLLNFSEQSV